MIDNQKIDAKSAHTLRSKTKLTLKESTYLKLSILAGDPWPSYQLMLHAWIAGAWPLLERLAMDHLEIDVTSARAYMHLAVSLDERGRSEEAERAIELAYWNCPGPESVEYEKAIVLAMDGRLEEAEQHFRKSIMLMDLKLHGRACSKNLGAAFQSLLEDNQLPIAIKFRDPEQ